jgi:hypothetical protein
MCQFRRCGRRGFDFFFERVGESSLTLELTATRSNAYELITTSTPRHNLIATSSCPEQERLRRRTD